MPEATFILAKVMQSLERRADNTEYKSEAWWSFVDAMALIDDIHSEMLIEQSSLWETYKNA